MLDVSSNVVQNKRVAQILFFKIRDGTHLEAGEILTYIKSPRNGSVCYFSSKLDIPSNVVQKKRVARILFFKIKPSREILKIRDGTPLKAGEILTYIKSPRNGSVCYFSSKLDVPSNVVQKIRVARILFFKIRPSREILKIRDGTPLKAGKILTYIKSPRNGSVCYFSSKLDVPSNVVQKIRVARILFFKIWPSREILKIRDGTPLKAGEILTYIKSPRNGSVCYFSSKFDVPSNVVQKKRVARILFFKIRPSREILKIRDGTPLEAGEILTYIKSPRNGSICYFSSKLDVSSNVVQNKRVAQILFFKIRPSREILKFVMVPIWSKLDVPSNVVQKKRVARILFFKIRPSREILKIRDGTPLKAGKILTYIKSPRNGSVCYFSSKLDVPSNVVQKIRVARILFFKIRPSREILKIRDGTPLKAGEILTYIKSPRNGAGEILTYIKSPRNGSVCYFSSNLDVPSNVVQKIRVARILFFKIRPSREILKIRDGTPFEAGEILTYIRSTRNGSIFYFYSKLDVPSNVVQKKRVARILFFKIRPSREILKIRDGTPLKAGEILTYIKSLRNGSVCYFSSMFDVPSNLVQKKRVARILFFKIRPSREILKFVMFDVPSNVVQKKRVARIKFFKIRPSREILKIRDGTPLKAGEILTYIKSPRNGSVCYFSSKLDVPSNVVQKIRVARIMFFKIRPSREILKIRDGTPLEAEEILTYIKSPRNGSICYFSSKLDVPSNVVQKKRVAQILFFKIRPSREILKIRYGTPLKTGEILTNIKSPRNGSVCYFSSKFDVPSNVVQKKRVAQILFFKIRPSREILKIRDGTPLEAGEILTYIKSPRNGSICYFSSKLDVSSNVVQNKRVAQILFFKIRPSREILKFVMCKLDVPSNVVQKKRVARILFFKIRPSREILKIRDGTPLKAGKILTYIKSPRNGSVCYFSSKLDVPSNVVQKIRVARILFFKIRPSREILKIRDGTPLKAGEILTYIKSPRNGSVCYFSSKFDVPSNVVQKKRVARILFFKIRPSREILKIRDGTPLEAGEILTYIKSPRNGSICYFSSKLDVSSNVVQNKRVAQILFFKIRPSREILKFVMVPIWSNVVQKKRVARILFFKIRPSREILKIRDGTPLKAGKILTYIKSPRNGSVCYFSSKLDVPSNVVQKIRVARILFFKIRPSREILKIRDGTPLKAGEILTYIKSPRNGSVCYFYSKLDVPSNVVQNKRVARILFFKIRPSREILKFVMAISRNFKNSLKAGEILTYIKSPRNGSVCYFSSNLDVPSNVVQKIRVARILFFKIRPSREILKIRDGTPFEAGEILTYIRSTRNGSIFYFYSKLDVPSNVVQKKRVARILFFKIRPSREILKIRDGTPLKAGEILTYIKSLRNGSVCYFSSMFDVPSNLVQKKRVARILFFKIRPSREILKFVMFDVPSNVVQKKRVARIKFFKIRPSREILKIRDGTPLKAGEILTYIKSPRNGSVCYFSSKLDVPSNVVQKIRVARIMFFKIRPSREILKIRDGTPLEAEEILTYIKSPRNGSICYFSSKLDVPSNVVQKKRVAQILFFKIRPSREILKIRDGTPLKTGEILTNIKSPRNGSVCYFSSKFDVPSNVVQKKRVAQILFFKIRPSREILKIRDGTPLEAGEILTYIKSPRNGSICYFSSKLDVSSNVVQNKRVAQILFFKIRPSREILKFVMVPIWSKLDIPSNVVQKKRVARILFFKIKPSREILKIRDGTPLKAGEILTYIKSPRNGSVCYFSSKLDVPSNVVQKIRVARILFFKIWPSREILKIRDGTPFELDVPSNVVQKKIVARILFFKIRPSREILKIRDGTPLKAGKILTYIKSPRNGSVCYFSSKLDVPSNVVQKIRVARILFFKIRPSREILKIRDGTPLKAGEILTYIKRPRNGSVCYFSSKLDVPSNVVQNKRVARILFFKIRPSREILKFVMVPLWSPRNGSVCYFSSNLDVPSNVVQKIRVARILFFKIRPSREILKIRDGTPFEAGEILTYIKSPRNGSIFYFYSKLDVPSNVVQKKRVARIMFFKIRPSREILKIRDGTPLKAGEILTYIKSLRNGSVCYFSSMFDVPSNLVQKKRVARIMFFKIRPSREILKIRDGTLLKAGEILTYIKNPRNGSVCYFYSKLYVPSNVVQKKRVAPILFFKIRPSQEILKIRDTPSLEAGEILTYIKKPSKRIMARIMFFKIRPSREILKIRDGTPLEAGEILTYIKSPRNGSICYFSRKLDVPSNVVQKKRVAQILFFKIRPSREILKIRDGTPLKVGEILTYIKSPRNGSVCYFYSKLYVPSNVVQKKRVAPILFFKIRPSQEILKIRDTPSLEAGEILTYIKKPSKRIMARIMFFKIRPSREILKIRDGTPLEAREILTYIKSPRNGSICYFSRKLDVPSNVVQKKRVAQILFFKIRPSREILKIRDGTPLKVGEILTYIKSPRNGSVCYFYSKLYVPSNVVQKKRVAPILFFKIRPSQEILKIHDTPSLEAGEILTYIKKPSKRIVAGEILTYIKSPRNGSVCYFSSKFDVPSNVVQKKRVARIMFFKIRPSREILKIRDGTPLKAGEILTHIKSPRNGSIRVARILFFKIRPSREILKIRDGTHLEAISRNFKIRDVCYFYSKLYVPSNIVHKKRVAPILFFKIRPSQEIEKIRDTPSLEAGEILTYIKKPSKRISFLLF
ncbi:hypothetical protein OROGR_018817 [Orobanche gracilis]